MNETAGNRLNRRSGASRRERLLVLLPALLREVDHYYGELGKRLQRTRRRFTEQLVTSEQTTKTGPGRCCYQITVRQCVPAAIPGGVTSDAELDQNGGQMHVHVGVKQPHGRNR